MLPPVSGGSGPSSGSQHAPTGPGEDVASLQPLQVERSRSASEDGDPLVAQVNEFGPVRKATWVSATIMAMSASLGVGILSLSDTFAQLGWVLGCFAIVAMAWLNMYTGALFHEAVKIYPWAIGPVELAHFSIQSPCFTALTAVVTSTYFFGLICVMFLTLIDSLQLAFRDVFEPCQAIWGAICLVILLPLLQFWSFDGMRWVLLLNFILVLVALGLFAAACVIDAKDAQFEKSYTEVIASEITFLSFFSAISKVMFAFMGTDLFLQFLAEMKDTSEFPRVLAVSNTVLFIVYAAFASASYALVGATGGDIFLGYIPHGKLFRIGCACLVVHVAISYALNAHYLIRWVHMKTSRESLRDQGLPGRFARFIISAILLVASGFVALGVPFFNPLVSLIGSVQGPFLGQFLPVIATLGIRKRKNIATTKCEYVVLVGIFLVGTLILVAGTTANIIDLLVKYEEWISPLEACTF